MSEISENYSRCSLMAVMQRFLFGVGLNRVPSTFDQKRGLKPVRYRILDKVGKVVRLNLIVFAKTNKINAT